MTRADRWLFRLGLLLNALPVLVVRHLPLQDYPQHLLIATVLAHPNALDFGSHFVGHLTLRPYLGYYGVALLLAPLVGPDGVARLCLLGYLVLTPIAVRAWIRAVAPAREPAAMLAVGLVWSSLYYLGFVNFLMALPALFGGAAALARFTRAPGLARGGAVIAFAAAAYLCHAMAFAMLVLVGLIVAWPASGNARRATLALVIGTGLAAAGLGWWSLGAPFIGGLAAEYVPHGAAMPRQGAGRGLLFLSPITSMLYLVAYTARDATLGDAALYGLPIGALAIAMWRRRRAPREPRVAAAAWQLPAVALALLFVVPGATAAIDYVNLKFAAILFLALPALVPARLLDHRTRVVLAMFAFASAGYSLSTHVRFDGEARSFDRVLPSIPPGARLLSVILEPGSDTLLWTAPFAHFGHLVQAEKGGVGAPLFVGPQIPVRTLGETMPGLEALSADPVLLRRLVDETSPDAILVRGSLAVGADPFGPSYRQVASDDGFAVLLPVYPKARGEPLR